MIRLFSRQKTKLNSYRTSWLELFFDLVFVALVAQLTYDFSHHHHTLEDFMQVGLVGYMIFLAWMLTTANRNIRQDEDLIDILAVQAQMVMVMIMSLSLPQAFGDYSWLFFGAMAITIFIGVGLIRRMYVLHPEKRPKTLNVSWGFFLAGCLWLLAGLFPTPYLYIVAGAALVLNILAPMTKGAGNQTLMMDMDHLLERLGLFLLMVMGEAVLVVALVNSAAGKFDLHHLVIVLSGLMQMIALWWWYFPYIHNHAQGKRAIWFQLMLQTHGFLYGSLILIAAGLKILVENPDSSLNNMWIFLAGIMLLVTTFNIIRATLTHHPLQSVKSVLGFVLGIGALISFCIYHQWPAYVMVPVVTAWLLLYVALDYRKHFGARCVIH